MCEFGADLDVFYFSVVYLQRLIKILNKISPFCRFGKDFSLRHKILYSLWSEIVQREGGNQPSYCREHLSVWPQLDLLSVAESRADRCGSGRGSRE